MAQFGLQRAHLSPHLERGLSDKAEKSQLGTPHSPNTAPVILLILLLILYLLPFDQNQQVLIHTRILLPTIPYCTLNIISNDLLVITTYWSVDEVMR